MTIVATGPAVQVRRFHVIALQVPIVFNADGDHDHNGLVFALEQNRAALEALRQEMADDPESVWYRRPHPLLRPLVLRARAGETVEICFDNHVSGRWVGIHLVADGYDVNDSDGADVGANPSSLTAPGGNRTYTWRDLYEGVFPFHDAGDLSGGEDGTNVHGLFGALVVEPARATWTDPVTGDRLDDVDANGWATGDGLYVDVHPQG